MKIQTAAILLLEVSVCALHGQVPPGAKPAPIQAEFTQPLHARNLQVGTVVLAHVTVDWAGPDCALRRGSIIEATVVAVDPRKNHTDSKLALAFNRAQCNGLDLKPMSMVLAALAGPPQDWSVLSTSERRIQVNFSRTGQIGELRNAMLENFNPSHLDLAGTVRTFPMSHAVFPGDVLNIKNLKLDPETGPGGGSVLTALKGDLVLPMYTQLLLVRPTLVARVVSSTPVATAALSSDLGDAHPDLLVPVAPPANDLSVCTPPGCVNDSPPGVGVYEHQIAATFPTFALGYQPRPHRNIQQFGDEECLAWLGPGQLLFAFNPHVLIKRTDSSGADSTERVIRVLLLDAESGAVIRSIDWQVADSHRYLWQLNQNRVLVHVGNELRVYGPGLEMERSIKLAGPLSFLRIAPNGEVMTVATVKERHSKELHEELRQSLGYEPEEDVDVVILDRDFNTIAQATTVSGLRPPTLLNEGQVSLTAMPHQHYQLSINTWDNKPSTLGEFVSGCSPELSASDPDLLFLLTCDPFSNATEYRVLRADGKPILLGTAHPEEVGHQLEGITDDQKIAFKVVHAFHPLSTAFSEAELEWEDVSVYDAAGVKRLMAARVDDPVAAQNSFALSPDGKQLAVLSQSQIQVFDVPPK